MVYIKVKHSEKDMFMFEAHYETDLDTVIRGVASINNLRVRLKNLVSELKRLKEKGPVLPERSLDEMPKIEELSLNDDEEDEAKQNSEPCYGSPISDPNLVSTVNKVIEEAEHVLSAEKANQKISVSEHDLLECIMKVKGVIAMAYPMGLPSTDPILKILDEKFVTKEMYDPETCTMWFCGKEFPRNTKLMDNKSIGRNDKTQIIAKLAKKGSGAPPREQPVSEEDQKRLMAYYYKKQEEQKKLLEDEDLAFTSDRKPPSTTSSPHKSSAHSSTSSSINAKKESNSGSSSTTELELPMKGLLQRNNHNLLSTPKNHHQQQQKRLLDSVDQSSCKQMISIHNKDYDDDDHSSVYSFDSILPSPPSITVQQIEKNVFDNDEPFSTNAMNIHHSRSFMSSNHSKRNLNHDIKLSQEQGSDEESDDDSDDELRLFSMKKSKKKIESNKKRKVSQPNVCLTKFEKLEADNTTSDGNEIKLVNPSLVVTQQQMNTKEEQASKISHEIQECGVENTPLEQSKPLKGTASELVLGDITSHDNIDTLQEPLMDEEFIVSLTPELEEQQAVTAEQEETLSTVNNVMNNNNAINFTQAQHENTGTDDATTVTADVHPIEDILDLEFNDELHSPTQQLFEKQTISEDEDTNIEVIVPKKMIDACTQTDKVYIPSYSVRNDAGDKNNICSICLHAWSSTGLHQVCCLGCGHLFGKNCIEKWLKKNSTCPKCKKQADRSNIRLLYIDNISAVDSQRLDQLEKQLEQEAHLRKTLETMKNGLELRVKMLMEQLGQSGSAVIQTSSVDSNSEQKEADQRKSLIQRSLELAERKKRDHILNDTEGSRVIQSSKSKKNQFPRKRSGTSPKQLFQLPLENSSLIELSNPSLDSKAASLLVSFESRDKTCGFYSFTNIDQLAQKPSLLLQSKKIVHNSPLTCIKAHYLLNIDGTTNNFDGYSVNVNSSNTHLILTSSLDKTVRITDSRQSGMSNSVCFCPYLTSATELEYESITCCEWNRSNANYCFASLSNGSILCYDIRKPSEPFLITGDKSYTQLHSMFHVPNVGLIVANSQSIRCYDENYSGYTKSYHLFSGNITSLRFNHVTNTCMFVGKENAKQSSIQFFKLNDKIQAICTDTLDISHKEELLNRPVFISSHKNNTLAIPKPNDHCVEIYRSYGDKELQLFTEIVENDNNSPIQNVSLFDNDVFVLTTQHLSMYHI
ncbi:hypothetical protein C9374_002803 [Naegleria lovaniensis]|uniref:RING-type domain-containing protein n=1 Tax=Naegleria lovaniensis TaxID=51637 RepID=A0AA88GSR5_NAELO|nr:uncharacterized protein C9374_002803 [Naegleria lovaniensis]KAG2386357.1 hypothetical protein C9374_002803 [Naegleria lovaniensis]